MKNPIILNFDQSVNPIENALILNLMQWQDDIRFGCSMRQLNRLKDYLNATLPQNHGTVFLGSGDYHHISLLLIERLINNLKSKKSIQVIIFDNHPDNMRYLFGIHCGSWVSHLTRLPFVSHVHVVGITSSDVSWSKLWENKWLPLIKGKLTYWGVGSDMSWANVIGLGDAFRYFTTPDDLITSFLSEQYGNNEPVYLSIDKDVLSPDVAKTNWDQGQFAIYHILDTITALDKRIIGSDVTGDISLWRSKQWLKRCLSSLDNQPTIESNHLTELQIQHQKINTILLNQLNNAQLSW